MTEVVLVRHGATQENLDQRYCGRLDPPLTPEAANEVRRTAGLLSGWESTHVYCSEALRARQTADIIAPGRNVIYLRALREMDFGKFEGLSANEIQSCMPDAWQAYMDDYSHFTFPDGDNVKDYLTNSYKTIKAIIREADGGRILIVAHKGFILSALSHLLHGDSDHIFCYDIRPAGFAKLVTGNGFVVLKHLV